MSIFWHETRCFPHINIMGEARRERVRLSKTFRLEKVLVNLSMIEMASSSGLRFPRFHSGNNLCHSQKILQKNTISAMKQVMQHINFP